MGDIANRVIDKRNSSLIVELAKEIAMLRGLDNSHITKIIHDAEDRVEANEAERLQKQLEDRKEVIASWPKIDFRNGTAPVCINCKSGDIHRNPEGLENWGCASCGYETTSAFIGFCQELACINCGYRFPSEDGKRPERCPECGQVFDPIPPF